ncbi:MAG: hypothetical protein J6T91_02885 [Alphaproteobacteria bacterium]|nr:hypothetical protein [Alphaproteobacteria bacterium]
MCGIFGRYSWRKCADAFFGRDTLRFVCSSGMDKISLAETRRKCADVSRCWGCSAKVLRGCSKIYTSFGMCGK